MLDLKLDCNSRPYQVRGKLHRESIIKELLTRYVLKV